MADGYIDGGMDSQGGYNPPPGGALPEETLEEKLQRLAGIHGNPYDVSFGSGENAAPPLLTNIPEERDAAKAIGQPVVFLKPVQNAVITPTTTVKTTDQLYAGIKSSIEQISAEPDPIKKQTGLADLEASFSQTLAEEQAQARKTAEANLGIPAYRNRVAELEKRDRLMMRKVDAEDTLKARQQLMQAESAADIHSQRLMRENPELVRMAKTIEGFSALQRQLIARTSAKAEAAESKAEQKKEALNSLLTTIKPEIRQAFVNNNPALADDEAFGNYIVHATTKGDAKERAFFNDLVTGNLDPKNFLAHGLAGSDQALNLAASEQAKRTGIPQGTINGVIGNVKKFMADDTYALNAMVASGMMNSKQAKAQQSKFLTMNTADRKEWVGKKAQMAEAFAGTQLLSALHTDVSNWPRIEGQLAIDQLPGAMPVMDKLKVNGRVGFKAFADAYINEPNLPPQEVLSRVDMLRSIYMGTVKALDNKFIWGNIDLATEKARVETMVATARVRRSSTENMAGRFQSQPGQGSLFGGAPTGFSQ